MQKIGAPALLLVLCLASPAWAFQARTKNVHDGDSITVQGTDKQSITVRLYGIDAPEAAQAYGFDAKKRLVSLVGRKNVDIEPVDTDRYGRTVALVRLPDGTLVNEAMVADGLAWVYTQYCHQDVCQRMVELERQARAERRGLWAECDPTRPSDWRREHKTEEWYTAPLRAMKSVARKIKGVFR